MFDILKSQLALAMDRISLREAVELYKELREINPNAIGAIKVHRLIDKHGAEAVSNAFLHVDAVPIIADMKILETPDSAYERALTLKGSGVYAVTIHTQDLEMMRAIKEVSDLIVIGVTVLSSEKLEQPIDHLPEILKRARLAHLAGLDAITCPALLIEALKTFGDFSDLKIMATGVRSEGVPKNDQKLIDIPSNAILHGADLLVVGRQILDASDRKAAFAALIDEINLALAAKAVL